MKADSTNFTFAVTTNAGGTGTISSPVVTNVWCTIMATYDASGNGYLYIDNSASVTFNISSNAELNDLKDKYTFMIGNNKADEFFLGKIWEVQFWAYAFTSAQV